MILLFDQFVTRINRRTKERKNERNEWMNGWMDGWMDEWMMFSFVSFCPTFVLEAIHHIIATAPSIGFSCC
jgi:hypothetical protein